MSTILENLTVLLVRIKIFDLPNEYSLAEMSRSLKRQVTSSTGLNVNWVKNSKTSRQKLGRILENLTVLLVRIKIFDLPNEYSLAEMGRSLKRQVTPSTGPPAVQ